MEQMIMVLVRLKRAPSIIMLADIFGISRGTASRIFISWIMFLKEELTFLLPVSTVEEMSDLRIPKPFNFKVSAIFVELLTALNSTLKHRSE